jgi:putative transposase
MANTYSCLTFHIIWSTKNRLPFITPEIRDRLYAYIGGIIKKESGKLICIGGIEDHVHLLISLHPNVTISSVVRAIKAKSSSFVKDILKQDPFSWQDGYGVFSVSSSAIERVMHYIDHQEQHHQTTTFQEEFVLFLKHHQIQYEDKYLP